MRIHNFVFIIVVLLALQSTAQEKELRQLPDYETWKQSEKIKNKEWPAKIQKQLTELKKFKKLNLAPHKLPFLAEIDLQVDHVWSLQQQKPSDINQQELLYEYNYLRDLLHKPHAAIIDLSANKWLEEVYERLTALMFNKDQELFGVQINQPHIQQLLTHFFEQAYDVSGYKDEIFIFPVKGQVSYVMELGISKTQILCLHPYDNLDYTVWIINHELGHLYYKDTKLKSDSQVIEWFKNTESKNQVQRANALLEVGKKSFDNTTKIGTFINETLTKNIPFWIPSADPEKAAFTLANRSMELRTELFAFENLYKQNNIKPLLHIITEIGPRNITAPSQSYRPHPSGFELALLAGGFLASKGIDLNKELRDYEKTGVCVPFKDLYHHSFYSLPFKRAPFRLQERIAKAIETLKETQERSLQTEGEHDLMTALAAAEK